MMKTTRIRSVHSKTHRNGLAWFLIRDSEGVQHATSDMFKASLCRRAQELDRPVTLWSASGWYYRDLITVDFADEPRPS